MPSISIVIPTLGRRSTLDRCLERLESQTSGDFELILVSDAKAPDPSAVGERLRKRPELCGRHVVADEPGASAARNAGWAAASADLVLFLDDDVLADRQLVEAHTRAHRRNPDEAAGVLGSLRWARTVRVTPFMRWLEDGLQFDFVALRGRDRTGWWHFYTCNASLKRSLLERVGGFDAVGFPFGYEDLDIGRRMYEAAGFYLMYERGAGAEHEHTMTLEQWLERIKRIAWSERRFIARYPDLQPHFHDRLAAAAARPAMRGRGARLAPLVPRRTPWLGERVWGSAEVWYAQQLAGPFLAAWKAAADEDPGPPPAVLGRNTESPPT